MNQIVETAREIFLKTGKPGFILSNVYDILLKNEEIEPIEYNLEELIKKVEVAMHHEAEKSGTIGLKELAHLRASNAYAKILTERCKTQTVANYFTLQNQIDNF